MSVVPAKVRTTLALVFIAFLLVNVIFLTMAIVSAWRGNVALLPPHLGEDIAFGVRIGIVLVGGFASWMCARIMFQQLVRQKIDPAEAVGPAWSLVSYLLLLVATISFLGLGSWLWLPLLFLIVTVWSVLTVWSMVGATGVVAGLVVALVGAALTAYVIA